MLAASFRLQVAVYLTCLEELFIDRTSCLRSEEVYSSISRLSLPLQSLSSTPRKAAAPTYLCLPVFAHATIAHSLRIELFGCEERRSEECGFVAARRLPRHELSNLLNTPCPLLSGFFRFGASACPNIRTWLPLLRTSKSTIRAMKESKTKETNRHKDF